MAPWQGFGRGDRLFGSSSLGRHVPIHGEDAAAARAHRHVRTLHVVFARDLRERSFVSRRQPSTTPVVDEPLRSRAGEDVEQVRVPEESVAADKCQENRDRSNSPHPGMTTEDRHRNHDETCQDERCRVRPTNRRARPALPSRTTFGGKGQARPQRGPDPGRDRHDGATQTETDPRDNGRRPAAYRRHSRGSQDRHYQPRDSTQRVANVGNPGRTGSVNGWKRVGTRVRPCNHSTHHRGQTKNRKNRHRRAGVRRTGRLRSEGTIRNRVRAVAHQSELRHQVLP